jgi:hypothetical protein
MTLAWLGRTVWNKGVFPLVLLTAIAPLVVIVALYLIVTRDRCQYDEA